MPSCSALARSALTAALVAFFALRAAGQEAGPAGVDPAVPANADAKPASARQHDGLYVRAGLGLGPSQASGEVEGFDAEFDVEGLVVASELAVGGTPAPGLVLGAGAYVASLFDPTYTSPIGDFEGGFGQLAVFAPFADFYPLPELGAHVQFAPGLAVATAGEGECANPPCFPPETYTGTGFGMMLGAGYDFWIHDEWSIGALARVLYASTTLAGSDSGLNLDAKVTLVFPSLLATATFH